MNPNFVDRLLEAGKPRGIMATKTVLPAAVTVAEALQIVCNSCLCQLIANKPGILASVSEALHQMRIATRRLQAAMKLFSEIASGRPAEHIAKELKWIAAELALARELDVFLSDVLVPLKKKYPTHINVAALYRACLKLRKKEYQGADAVLGSERYRMFLLAAAEWTEAGHWQTKPGDKSRPNLQQRARDVAAEDLSALRKKMKKGRRMEKLDPRSLHKLRLRAKRMRYVIEFTESVFCDGQNSKRIDSALTSLKYLQSNLGALNDIAAQKGIFDRIAAMPPNNPKKRQRLDPSVAAKLIFGNQKRRMRKLLKKSVEAYEQFERMKPFWS
jgi:triphosphatase